MSNNSNIIKTFSDPLIWCESYLRDPRDRDKPLVLRSYQKDVLKNTRKYKSMVNRWGRRCLAEDSPIQLYNGDVKKIQDILINNKVISWTFDKKHAVPGNVSNIFVNGIQDIFEILLENDSILQCTSNHPLLILKNTTYLYKQININLSVGNNCVILNKDYTFSISKIVDITYIGKKQTYDITVDDYHNFSCNNIISHNSGKSVTFCADTLWWTQAYPLVRMIETGALKQKSFRVLVFCPYESQIKELWNTYTQLIGDSPLLMDQLVKIRTSDIHLIEFKGPEDGSRGSTIEGYTIGISSSNQGTSLRGLSSDMVFIDEMDYIPSDIIEQVILPITTTHVDVRLRICSTPSGKREKFYNFCTTSKEIGWYHSHIASWHPDNTNWRSIAQAKELGTPIEDSSEFQVRHSTTSSAFEREYGAEFGEEFGGVYKHSLINSSIVKYNRNADTRDLDIFDPGFQQNPEHKYIVGVDWNSYINGGQVVMVEYCSTPTFHKYYDDDRQEDVVIDFTGKYRLFFRRSIKSQESTQRMTRQEVIRLMLYYKVDYVYVDYGAGDTNIEELSLYGRGHPELRLDEKLVVIDSGAVAEHYDHILGKKIKKRNKTLMVNFSVISLEEGMFLLPKEEDQGTRLVGQMRGYTVKNITARGEYSYEGEDHILDAFNLAIYGFQQKFGQLMASRIKYDIMITADPRMQYFPTRAGLITTPVPIRIKNSYNSPIRDPEKPLAYPNKTNRSAFPMIGSGRSSHFNTGRRSF